MSGEGEETIEFRVRGMRCATCAGAIEEALRGAPGVRSAAVSLASERAAVSVEPGKADRDELFRRVRLAGYEPVEPRLAAEEAADEARGARRELLWVVAAAVPAAALMALMLAPDLMHRPAVAWASLAAATFVQLGPGLTFYAGAARALRAG